MRTPVFFRMWCLAIAVGQGAGAMAHASDAPAATLARPSDAQYAYQEQERIMFVCLDPCTWQGREYDNHTTHLKDMKLAKLDVNQWCEAARSWGAKEILFVAKHTGGFCWWQTVTSDYSVKNIAWKDGKGNLVDDVAAACRRHGLKLGIYVYPGDDQWGAGIGSGGRTTDPAKQQQYNAVLQTQWAEVLSRHHDLIIELWFDGSCCVPLGDVFERYVGDRVVYLQGPHASLRWVGNEASWAPYPAWNTLKKKDLDTGVATALQNDPDGDAWAALECDTTLYDQYWFWSAENEKKRKSLAHLVKLYYQSVGRGASLLLNSTPNTDGLIPEDDMKLYAALGRELERRFRNPLGSTAGRGSAHTIAFEKPTKVNQFVITEDYREGQRIREFVVEGRTSEGRWIEINRGTAVGRKRIVMFEPVEVTRLALRIASSVGEPIVRDFAAYWVDGENSDLYEAKANPLSQNAKATASDEHSAPYVAGKICDGDAGTWWGVSPRVEPPYDCWVELDLGCARAVNETAINEPWNRTEEFALEYRADREEEWKTALRGGKMGPRFRRTFEPVAARYWRLHIVRANHFPAIAEWELFGPDSADDWRRCGAVGPEAFDNGQAHFELKLSKFIDRPGQFLLRLDDLGKSKVTVQELQVLYDGLPVHENVLTPLKPGELYLLNRQAQVVADSKITLKLRLATAKPDEAKVEVSIKRGL
jgi:alpha-L-fucosidase